MFLTNRLTDPGHGFRIKAGGVSKELSEVIVIRRPEMVLDDNQLVCSEIPNKEIKGVITDFDVATSELREANAFESPSDSRLVLPPDACWNACVRAPCHSRVHGCHRVETPTSVGKSLIWGLAFT